MISTRNGKRLYNSVPERQNENRMSVALKWIYKPMEWYSKWVGFLGQLLAVLTRLRSHTVNPERRRERRERLNVELAGVQRATATGSCSLPRQARCILQVIAV